MSTRRRAREVVIQLLFQRDLNPDVNDDAESRFLRSRLQHKPALVQFAGSLLAGIEQQGRAIDEAVSRTAENWRLERMAATDRSILRLATYEILYTDTPPRVVINEAIELAKRFGTGNSAPFVNGLLDRLVKSRVNPPGDSTIAASLPGCQPPANSDDRADCD